MEDERIIDLFFARDEDAIAELDKKYGKACRSVSYHILGNREDVEECVHDSYLGAWNKIPPEQPNPLYTYIARIVRNQSLKRYYQKQAEKRKSNATVAMEELEGIMESDQNLESAMDATEIRQCIESFLDKLSKENRVIFIRRYWYNESCREIGKRVGLNENLISVRLARIREKLRDYLIENEVEL